MIKISQISRKGAKQRKVITNKFLRYSAPLREKIAYPKSVVCCLLSVVCCLPKAKRQQKTISPYCYLFTFANEQQPCGYELRASRSEHLLMTHSSLLTAKKYRLTLQDWNYFLKLQHNSINTRVFVFLADEPRKFISFS